MIEMKISRVTLRVDISFTNVSNRYCNIVYYAYKYF